MGDLDGYQKQILAHTLKKIDLTEIEQNQFLALIHIFKIKKKQTYICPGTVCNTLSYVIEGCMKIYYEDPNSVEHILYFEPKDWWVTDLQSFITQEPANLTIETMENTVLWQLTYENHQKLLSEIPKFERFFRLLSNNALAANYQRIIDGLSLSAEQKYEQFCKRYPMLVYTIPQKHIASYIGVTPEFLSKMMKIRLKTR